MVHNGTVSVSGPGPPRGWPRGGPGDGPETAGRSAMPADVGERALSDWCHEQLGAPVAGRLFTTGHLSAVYGLRLADGRDVVLKVRDGDARLSACMRVQRRLWEAGFCCPEPLAGPYRLGSAVASAETLLPAGDQPPRTVLGLGPVGPRLQCQESQPGWPRRSRANRSRGKGEARRAVSAVPGRLRARIYGLRPRSESRWCRVRRPARLLSAVAQGTIPVRAAGHP